MRSFVTGALHCSTRTQIFNNMKSPLNDRTRNTFISRQRLTLRENSWGFASAACNTIPFGGSSSDETVESLWLRWSFFKVSIRSGRLVACCFPVRCFSIHASLHSSFFHARFPHKSLTYGFKAIKLRLSIAADLTTCETVVVYLLFTGSLREGKIYLLSSLP